MSPINLLAEGMARDFRVRLEESLRSRLQDLRVFGSMARGRFDEDSDLDILVLVDRRDVELERLVDRVAWEVSSSAGFPFRVAPLVMTGNEYERSKAVGRRLVREIEADGVPI